MVRCSVTKCKYRAACLGKCRFHSTGSTGSISPARPNSLSSKAHGEIQLVTQRQCSIIGCSSPHGHTIHSHLARTRCSECPEHLQTVNIPVYGYIGKRASKCYKHKLSDMTKYLAHNLACSTAGCHHCALYGYAYPKFCTEHKKDDMRLVEQCNCRLCQPGVYARNHPELLDIDACHKIGCVKSDCYYVHIPIDCEIEGCMGNTQYGYVGYPLSLCWKHRVSDMIRAPRHSRYCSLSCAKIALYGYKDRGSSRCEEHKQPHMVLSPDCKCRRCVAKDSVYSEPSRMMRENQDPHNLFGRTMYR